VSAFNRYAGYAPTNLITDYAAIDMDQEEFNLQLADRRVEMAMNIYQYGGHSGSYAVLNVTGGSRGLSYPVGTVVHGLSSANDVVNGTLLEAMKFTGSSAQVKVLYDVGPEQLYYVDCQVGGLWTVNRANRAGCKYSSAPCFGFCRLHGFPNPLLIALQRLLGRGKSELCVEWKVRRVFVLL
jgi:hypothetical protein